MKVAFNWVLVWENPCSVVLVLEVKFVSHQWTVSDGSKCGPGEASCETVLMVWRTFCKAEVSIVTLGLSFVWQKKVL